MEFVPSHFTLKIATTDPSILYPQSSPVTTQITTNSILLSKMKTSATCVLLAILLHSGAAWSSLSRPQQRSGSVALQAVSRRSILSSAALIGVVGVSKGANAADDDGDEQLDFSTIASRAAKISQALEEEIESSAAPAPKPIPDGRTAYDFALPVAGETVSFGDLVKQDDAKSKVKAILVVNIKQDDPIARKNIPEFISLASK